MLQFQQLQIIIVLFFLAAAAVSDLKKREVPNWVNYGLVTVGIGFGLLQSAVAADWHFVAFSIAGTAAALAFAALMFYTGQWGGGDSKLLIGMGAVLGLSISARWPFSSLDNPFISFLFNLVAVSLLYALVMGTFIVLKNKGRFAAELKKQLRSYAAMRKLALVAAVVGLIAIAAANDFFVRLFIVIIIAAMFFALYLSIMAKAVERSCMLKRISPLKLTEGDWIAEDITLDKKTFIVADKKQVGKNNIVKLREFALIHNPIVQLKRKYLFFSVKRSVPVSDIIKGDILLQAVKLNSLVIKKFRSVNEETVEGIYDYFRRHTLFNVSVQRQLLFGTTKVKVDALKLNESDVLLEDLKVGYFLAGPKDLGVEKQQIRKLIELYRKGKIRNVLVKEGIPFAPAFLIAYLLVVFSGNIFFAFVR